ncbi:MAG: NTPase [Thermodesulfovibrionales bacterium]
MALKILITGEPGSGKTTLVKRLARSLPGARGFYTEEMREGRRRVGFRLVALGGGGEGMLSHEGFKGPRRVGRYGVDLEGFESFLAGLGLAGAETVVVDEIGKMECLSEKFNALVEGLLRSDKTVIATIGKRGTPFMERLKKTPGARLLEVDEKNREEVLRRLRAELSAGP